MSSKSDYLVISTSLNPDSNSRKLAKHVFELFNEKQAATWLDLNDYQLPICDGDAAYSHGQVKEVSELIEKAQCLIVAAPIYNFAVGASLKNLIELTGQAWQEKIVGFLLAAGGKSGYMAVMGIANSLMLDFRCLIIPRFVYADGQAFLDDQIDETIKTRLGELASEAVLLTEKVKLAAA